MHKYNSVFELVIKTRIFIIFLFLFISQNASANQSLIIKDNQNIYSLSKYVEYFEDKNNTLRIEDFLTPSNKINFNVNKQNILNFGFSDSTFWFRFNIQNQSSLLREWLINVGYPLLDDIKLYIINDNNVVIVKQGGDLLPFGVREIHSRNYIFNLPLTHIKNLRIYLSVKTSSSVQVPLTLLSKEEFYKCEYSDQLIQGILLGILLVMILYHLVLFFQLNDVNYLYYVFYVSGCFIWYICYSGISFEYLWPDSPIWNNKSTAIFINISVLFGFLFTNHFLDLKSNLTKWYLPVLSIVAFSILLSLVSLFFMSSTISYLSNILAGLSALVGLTCGIFCLIMGFKPAKYFVIAWSTFLLGIIILIGSKTGILPRNTFTEYSLEFFQVLQIILFSLAIGDKYRGFKEEQQQTQEKILKNQLESADKLKLEVDRQTLELREKNETLQAMAQQRTLFFQNISHEFRTPLTLIIGPLEAAISGSYGQIQGELNEQHMIMLRNARRLLRLINQLLDISKIEAGGMKLHVKPVDLVRLLKSIVTAFKPLSEKKKIALNLKTNNDELISYFDTEKIEKIIFNLVSNAIKFTEERGEVLVSVLASIKFVEIKVKDSGIGIPEEFIDTVFNRFTQVDESTTREQEGTGIGLSLVKNYVDLHHGEITVESYEGIGTEFTVKFPLDKSAYNEDEIFDISPDDSSGVELVKFPDRRASQRRAQNRRQTDRRQMVERQYYTSVIEISSITNVGNRDKTIVVNAASDLPKVLIVEDNRDMRLYIGEVLKPYYSCYEAMDGEDGFRMALDHKPELILSDVMMPKMDGYQLLAALKKNETTSNIPVILLTAKATEDMKVESLQLGAEDYIAKPFNPKELLARTNNILTIRQQSVKIKEAYKELQLTKDLLVRAEKLASLGILSAGISHEINNPNNFISSSSILAIESIEDLEDSLKVLDEIDEMKGFLTHINDTISGLKELISQVKKGSKRINDVVMGLKGFSHLHEAKRHKADINEIIKFSITSLKFLMHDKIDLELYLHPIHKIDCDPVALGQVFIHILRNAAQAIEDKGTITVSTGSDDNNINIDVIDDGRGVTKEDLPKIFDPFFTTREVGKGLGLGLSLCFGIIEGHGGRIDIESEPDVGTRVTISLPKDKM